MDTTTRWTNRRRMAWLALWALIGIGVSTLFLDIGPPQSDVIIAVVYTLGAVVGAYVGFATLDDKWRKGEKNGA